MTPSESLAHRALAAQNFSEMAVQRAFRAQAQILRLGDPEREEERKELALAVIREFLPQFLDAAVKVYTTVYTDTDLEDLIAFYESPIGLKVLAVSGELVQLLGSAAEVWAATIVQALRIKLQE